MTREDGPETRPAQERPRGRTATPERDAPETRRFDALRFSDAGDLPSGTDGQGDRPTGMAGHDRSPARRSRGAQASTRLLIGGILLLATAGLGWLAETAVYNALTLGGWTDWTVLAGFGLLTLALALWLVRQWRGLRRLSRLSAVQSAARAAEADDGAAAERAVALLEALYARQPAREWDLAAYRERAAVAPDPFDRMAAFETLVLSRLDDEAKARVTAAIRQVTAGTAVSPFALLDMAVTAVVDLRLTGEIAAIYGGRPALWATLRVFRQAFLAVLASGTFEAADDIVGDLLGVGIAGRMSGKAGAALANGFMTGRLGVAAIDLCRPAPWREQTRPRARGLFLRAIGDLAGAGAERGKTR